MLVAMSLAAGLCIFIGCYPWLLYSNLPFAVDYAPFDIPHVVEQIQLLFFSALAFVWLQLKGLYPPELKSTNLDAEWVHRRVWPTAYAGLVAAAGAFKGGFENGRAALVHTLTPFARKQSYDLLMPWSTKGMVQVTMALLAVLLLAMYIYRTFL